MIESPHFMFGDSHPIEDIGGGIKRQLLGHNQQILMAKVWFSEDAIGYVHDHFHAQVAYVESGEFDVTVGDETKTLKGGDSFYIPPNMKHGAVCKKAGVLIDVFSPRREDFISPLKD